MTVTNSNFTEKLFFLTYKSGIKDENNIDKVDDFFEKLNDLRTKDRTLLFNKQNLNDWKLKKHIPVMKNAVSLPILEAYLFTYKEFLIENSKSLFEQCVSHIKNLKKEYLNVLSSDSGGNIFFQGTKKKSAKINFLGERHSEDIKNLGHHIYGLYVSIRYRFNKSSHKFPEIAVEVIYIYPDSEGMPHFTMWYLRAEKFLSKYKGIAYPAGRTYWLHGYDKKNNLRPRFMCLTKEEELGTDFINPHSSLVRGGIMLSDTQDTAQSFPAACRFILIKSKLKFVENNPSANEIKSGLEKYARRMTRFVTPNNVDKKRGKTLKVINNQSVYKDRKILLMPQSWIDSLTNNEPDLSV